MIHFRYHLMTIAAIFLALGIGILLGGTMGQSWFTVKQQEFLLSMEQKYDHALKSNSELKQQVNQLIVQVEQSNNEVLHLMTTRYADDLQGQTLYVWRPEGVDIERVERLFASVGVKVVPYLKPTGQAVSPLLVFGREKPEWLNNMPTESVWMQIETLPDSPAKQWKLLENVQRLLEEKRWQLEKS